MYNDSVKKILMFAVVFGIISSLWFYHALSPVDASSSKNVPVNIEQGSSLSAIASELSDAALIRSPLAFTIYARITGNAASLQAGVFSLSPSMSTRGIIEMLVSGKSQEFSVTIPEGFTVADIDRLLASKGLGKEGDIVDCAFHCDFSTFEFLPTPILNPSPKGGGETGLRVGSRLEGYLFPDTYSMSPSDYVPKFFLERMLGNFRKRIVTPYASEAKREGMTFGGFVTMASLVEAESRHAEERAFIAGILWKRLQNRVVLGVDATTRYVLGKRTESLTKADVETDSPYNTRRRQGLPPSPICNGGESSFLAALRPKDSKYWYYLHDPKGVIHYAVTNDEHNLNKARYLPR